MNPKITELEEKLKAAPEGTVEKVDVLNDLSWELWGTEPETAIELANESYALAEKLGYEKGLVHSKFNKAVETWRDDIESTFNAFLEALSWFEEHGDRKGEADACSIIGVVYWGFGDFEKGFDLVHRAKRIYRELKDAEGEGWTQNSLGGFYYDLKDYQRSHDYFEKGLALFEKTGNVIGQGRSLNGMGNAYHFMGDHKKALKFHTKTLEIQQKAQHKIGESRTLNDIGLIYQSLGDLEMAMDYHQQSLAIRREINYPPGETTSMMDVADVYIKQGKYDKALEMLNETLALSNKIKAKPKAVRALKTLTGVYEKLGDFEQALKHFKQFHELEEEVFHEDANKKLKNMKAAYQLETSQKEAEIYRLRNGELKEKNEQLKETIRKLNATQAQLVQSGKMVALGNLVAGIAHEINTPIGTIKSGNDVNGRIADRLMAALESDTPLENLIKELQKSLKVLNQNNQNNLTAVERIVNIINSLKNFSRLDEAKFQKADIHDGIDSALTLIGHEIKEKVYVKREYGDIPEVYLYPDELNQVFMNLLINAVQATPQNGMITIKTAVDKNNICITISDTGKGIPAEKLTQLFEPGFTSDHSRVKMRTGLYTSYNIINKHNGDIKAESQPGKGTTFTIRIPQNLNELITNGKKRN